ncbi:MAG: oligosaccharide flippase family protein [Chloroflexota bacterium]
MDKNFITKFLKGSAATTIGTLATVLFQFLSIAWMTDYVSPQELGLYFLMLAIANGGKIIGTLGLDLTLVQFLAARNAYDQRHAFALVLIFRLSALSVLTILCYLLGWLIIPNDDLVIYRWILPTVFVLMSFRELFLYVLQGLQMFRNLAINQTISAILKFAMIWLLAERLNLVWLTVVEIVMLGTSLVYIMSLIPYGKYRFNKTVLKYETLTDVYKFGAPIYVNSVVTYVSGNANTFIINFFLSEAAIAAFGIAAKIPEGIARLFVAFRVVYFPTLSELFSTGNIKNAGIFMNKCLTIIASVTFAGVLLCYFFSQEILLLFFSEEYLETEVTFILLVLGICLKLLINTMGYSLVSSGNPGSSTIINIATIVVELILSVVLIYLLGYVGGAWALVITSFLGQALSFYYLRGAGIPINFPEYVKPYIFLLAVGALYYFLNLDSLIYRISLLALYTVVTAIFVKDCREALIYVIRFIPVFKKEQPNLA